MIENWNGEVKKTILLVEDEIIIAMSEQMILEKFGYRIIIAYTGEQAVEIAVNNPDIDLILMDIDLGKGIDGTETAEIILLARDLPVVFLSSHTEPEVVEKTEKITSYGYVVKNSANTVLDASIKMAFKLFAAKKKIVESENRFRTMFEEAPLGIALIDSFTGKINEVNQHFAIIAGRTQAEMKAIDWMSITHPDDVQEDLQQMERMNAGEISGFHINNRYLHPDNSVGWISMTIAPLVESDRKNKRHLCMIEDITERKTIEESLQKKMDELERFHRLTVGRELMMIELKKEINALLSASGKEEKYRIAE